MSSVIVLVKYSAQPGKAETARRELSKLIETVQANEVGCLGISLHQNRDEPEGLLLLERWKDRGTFEGPHMQTPYLQAFIGSARNFLAGPPEMSFWEPIDA